MMKALLSIVAILCVSSLVIAAPVVRKANFDPEAGLSQYQVNFPIELGGNTIVMPITGGSFELETDAEARTSRIVSWTQEVSAIEIFGMSTGPIVITLEPGTESSGTYNPDEETFSVTASFLITFDDTQLSQVGFFSPLPIQGTENGNLYGVGSIGTIRMFLEGGGSVGPSTFSYTCHTSARFEYVLLDSQAQPGDVNHDKSIDISDPVAILGSLFSGGDPIACPEAAEVNGDSAVDLSDTIFLLTFLFQGGSAPPAEPVTCAEGR